MWKEAGEEMIKISTKSKHRRSKVDGGLLVQSGREKNGLIHFKLSRIQGDTGLGTLQLSLLRSSMGGGWESIQDGDRRWPSDTELSQYLAGASTWGGWRKPRNLQPSGFSTSPQKIKTLRSFDCATLVALKH